MPNIKRINADQLRVGMYVADLNNEWVPDNNLSKHGLLKRAESIEQIRRLGVTHIYIDTDKGEDCQEGIPQQEVNQHLVEELNAIQNSVTRKQCPPVSNSDNQANPEAKQIHVNAIQLVSQVMEDVKMGNAIALNDVETMADSINESIRRNQNALSCFTRLRHTDEYLIEHSFSVAVLMGVLGRSMGYGNDDLHQIVTGGLLHDIGKVQIPDSILNKPSSLDSDEWEEMKRHVIYGEQILNQAPNVPAIIHEICAQHHERLDGTGYPRGLSGKLLTEHGKMGAIVDVYDAITADRVYHRGMLPTLAMKKLLEWSDGHLDKDITYQFIACMSIYPAGSLVELSNNTLAIVVDPNQREQHKPTVKVIYDVKAGKTIPEKTLNLAHSETQESIVRAVEPLNFDIDLGLYLN